MPNILSRRALRAGRIGALDASSYFGDTTLDSPSRDAEGTSRN